MARLFYKVQNLHHHMTLHQSLLLITIMVNDTNYIYPKIYWYTYAILSKYHTHQLLLALPCAQFVIM